MIIKHTWCILFYSKFSTLCMELLETLKECPIDIEKELGMLIISVDHPDTRSLVLNSQYNITRVPCLIFGGFLNGEKEQVLEGQNVINWFENFSIENMPPSPSPPTQPSPSPPTQPSPSPPTQPSPSPQGPQNHTKILDLFGEDGEDGEDGGGIGVDKMKTDKPPITNEGASDLISNAMKLQKEREKLDIKNTLKN
jgi:hypothetical protein